MTISIKSPTSTTGSIQKNGSDVITIDASDNVTVANDLITTGNVGIGTSSPDAILTVSKASTSITVGTSTAIAKVINSQSSALGETAGIEFFNRSSSGSAKLAGVYGIYTDYNATGYGGALAFATESAGGTNVTERMRIDASGNVLVGTTSLLADNAAVNAKIFRATEGYILRSHRSITGASPHYYFFNPNGFCGKIETNGSSTSYVTSSDYRLKDNVVPITGALEKVTQLNPVIWKWKVDGSNGQGFIAHELAEVVPDCVSGEKDAVETYTDEDGVEQTRPKYQGIDTSFLVATLTAAIQEQQAIIETLTTRIEALEAK